MQHVLIDGRWRESESDASFQSFDPARGVSLDDVYPVSRWEDLDAALDAAHTAFEHLRVLPRDRVARFLERYADRIEANGGRICEMAERETALPLRPRLLEIELPRTVGQLRQAAEAARVPDWTQPVIDTALGIRSCLGPLGPVAVFGPNNFPLAFGSISGGDFAAAIAAGCPVIAKANSMHPGTTRLLAVEADQAATETEMPAGLVQMIYRTAHEDGCRWVRDSRLGAVGYTGSRSAGLRLKEAADAVGKPIYLELSSINPCLILPGALAERADQIADEFCTSCLMGTGQFCTNPGLVLLLRGALAEAFVQSVAARFDASPVGTLLSESGRQSLAAAIDQLAQAGANLVCGGASEGGPGVRFANTLMRVTAETFLQDAQTFQTEAFGNASLFVIADSIEQLSAVLQSLDGNLTGTIYSDSRGGDDAAYADLEPLLRQRVGRLINDKMPTGVAVSPAMNHGGPFPATGHPGFTAVGIPAAIRRFGMLQCYDQVRSERLPDVLQDANPLGVWRCVDGRWTQAGL